MLTFEAFSDRFLKPEADKIRARMKDAEKRWTVWDCFNRVSGSAKKDARGLPVYRVRAKTRRVA